MTAVLRRRLLGRTLGVLAAWPFASLGKVLGYPRLMQGPMVGASGPTHITVWVRASGELPVQVEYSRDSHFASSRVTDVVQTRRESDFTATVRVPELEPNTRYYYRVRVDGAVDRYHPLPFVTKTAPTGAADFRVAFGSCARFALDREQRIFDGVQRLAPDLFLWLGDNIYADTPSPEAIAEEYRRQRGVERLQPVIQSIPQLATWDDHDFGYNNSDGTSPFKSESLAVFKRYWANPAAGLPEAPGVFFEYAYGGVDFFVLDGRYHRTPNSGPDGADKTLLGAVQRRWLQERLLASRAPFKVLVCGSGWSSADGPDGDTWATFLTERNALFDFIRDRGIGGVVCLSGDSHVGELNCIPWSERGGYDIYDLVSSPLAQPPGDSWVEQSPEVRMRAVYAKGANFGLLSFAHEPEPTLTFTLHDPVGESVWEPLVLKAGELANGVSTWKDKISRRELQRREQHS